MRVKTTTSLIAVLLIFCTCQNFYKAPVFNDRGIGLDSLALSQRYFVLRSGGGAFHIKKIELSEDKKTAVLELDTLSMFHSHHLLNGPRKNLKYKINSPTEKQVINEVHFYLPQTITVQPGPYILDLSLVQKIEVLQHNNAKTTTSYIIGALGYTLGAFVAAGIIIADTKSSCPFVSAFDGTDFTLQGEIYGGAIYPQLARHDYLPLKMAPLQDGTLQLKISNELKERQFTDFADLLVITHAKNSKVLADCKV